MRIVRIRNIKNRGRIAEPEGIAVRPDKAQVTGTQ
jgi:hypothetical protein